MPRAKGGVVLRRRHNKILKMTKGQRMSRHLLWHRANEAMLKSLFYASRDRRTRKRDMRGLWIARINAAARLNGITYSRSDPRAEVGRHPTGSEDSGRSGCA